MKGWPFIGVLAVLTGLLLFSPPAGARTAGESTYLRTVKQGFALLRQGDARGALDRFEEALRSYDGDAAAYVGIGAANFHLHDDAAAESALRKALERNPQEKLAYQVLGDLAYRHDDLAGAEENWERALAIDPSDGALRARLEKTRREHRTEEDFNREYASHFSIKYEGRELIEPGRIVLRTLEGAYGDVGRQLSFYPDREIAVILYSGKQFREVTDAPGWSGGIFDGKIRLPIGGIEHESMALRAVLYHEYTHAVVRAIAPKVPAWLNEGLAQYFEGRTISASQQELLRTMCRAGRLPPLNTLEASFLGYGSAQANYAYLVSLSAVRYMIDDYGMFRVRTVLDELGAGAELSRAISNGLMVSFEEFERGWKRSFE